MTSEDEEVKHLVEASLPVVASGEGEASGVESTFFLEFMVCGVKGGRFHGTNKEIIYLYRNVEERAVEGRGFYKQIYSTKEYREEGER